MIGKSKNERKYSQFQFKKGNKEVAIALLRLNCKIRTACLFADGKTKSLRLELKQVLNTVQSYLPFISVLIQIERISKFFNNFLGENISYQLIVLNINTIIMDV